MAKQKINLETKTSPSKEQRLGSVKAYHGKVSELLKETKDNDLQWKSRGFEQASMCMLTQVTMRLVTIRDSALIIHGPVGCAASAAGYRENYKNVPVELGRPDFEFNWISTNLTENDVVFGGEKKLAHAIREAQRRYNPKSILVVSSCTSGVIGDDIEGVIDGLRPEIKAKIVPIHCEGFRSQISQSAFDAAAHAIVKHLVDPPRRKQEDLVNIIAPFSVSWADRLEIQRVFAKIGLRPLLIPDFATTEELSHISEAAVTAPTCVSYGNYLQEALFEKYGVPYFRSPAPLGISNTSEWLRNIAKYTGKEKEVEALIKEELEIVLPELERFKKQFKGKDASILVSAGQARATFIPRFAAELGMKIAAVNTLELDPDMIEDLEKVYQEVGDFEVHASDVQPYEQSHMLGRLKPELYTGCPFMGLYKREASNVRNHSFRSDFSAAANQFLYRGLLNYGYVMQRALNNPSVCKTLSRRTSKPYKQWWYDQENMLKYVSE